MSVECVIGLDIGGTKIAGGVVAFPEGLVRCRRTIATRADRGGEPVLQEVIALARELFDQARAMGLEPVGIGAGVAELVDLSGNVTSGATLRWKGTPVAERLSEIAPAVVESDVRAAALGEAWLGAGRGFREFVYVTVGTGISSTLVQGGRPYAGARGNALVMASAPASTTCNACGTQLHPVLEEFASGPAMARRYAAAGGHSVCRGEDVTAAAEAGVPLAVEIVSSAGEALGVGVAFLANVLDPAALVVGGGVGLCGGLYWRTFEASTRAHIWAENTRELPILPARLGPDAGMIGAAASYWYRGFGSNGKSNLREE